MSEYRYDGKKLILSESEWRERLTPEQFEVLRESGTELACSNPLHKSHETGIYVCAGCNLPLFSSNAKYDSGTGWPSFFQPIFPENVTFRVDHHLGYARTEVVCSRCEGHLGHVFDDGPPPTRKRFCMNAAAMNFIRTK